MSKRIAVIDLGSNSARLAIFERTSRLGFFILREYKVKVRLGHGAYENGGMLQDAAIAEVLEALSEFKTYIKLYKVRKIIAGGTSALRDAPNKAVFLTRLKNELGIAMKVISGEEEASLGGIAASNLLPPLEDALCVDIGGGSTELARIKDGKMIAATSLNLGTVRLKELFYDKGDLKGATQFIKDKISTLNGEFKSEQIVAIGGSLRAISKAIMERSNYAYKVLHGFCYELRKEGAFIKKIANAKPNDLKELCIKKERFDTITGGASIFDALCAFAGAKSVLTSGVGVREGLFLRTILRPSIRFPKGFNPSLKSLSERFCVIDNAPIVRFSRLLFKELAPLHALGEYELGLLSAAARVFNAGRAIGYYSEAQNSAYIVRSGLNYGYTHEQICAIAAICELNSTEFSKADLGEFADIILGKNLNITALKWLCYILALARNLGVYAGVSARFHLGVLIISGASELALLKANIKKLVEPIKFEIIFE